MQNGKKETRRRRRWRRKVGGGWVNKSENRRVGELAKDQQGNSDARANIERATYTDGQKERGMEEWDI